MSLNPARNLIGGRLVGAANGASFENVNPATEEVSGVCANGTRDGLQGFEEYLEAKVIALPSKNA
jgi:hypothetical protein